MMSLQFFCDFSVKFPIYKELKLAKPVSVENLSQCPFSLNSHLIDASKGMIWVDGQAHSIEPKVMHVLLVLVANRGNVVGQEQIFSQVWPHSIFSPGSIRRCIASLRKVLDDNNATTSIITTHPKKGYCLNAELALLETDKKRPLKIFATLAVAVLAFMSIILFQGTELNNHLDVAEAIPVTATEHQEFNALISPDGNNIGFIRVEHSTTDSRGLWIKNLSTETEAKIIQGVVKTFAWSPTASQLAYSLVNNGKESIRITSLESRHLSNLIAEFTDEQRISSLQWGKDEHLYVLTRKQNQVRLLAIETKSGTQKVIAQFDPSFAPYEINLSLADAKMALVGFDQAGNSQVKTLSLGSGELEHVISLNRNRYFISWHPSNKSILFSDGRLLNLVDLDGSTSPVNFENFDFARHPHFTPDGKGILVSLGKLDTDILISPFNEDEKHQALINSNTVDRSGALSPDKGKLVFISHRKGFPQVYVFDMHSRKTQLVYKNDQRLLGISQPVWHPNSQQIAFANYEYPILVSLDNGLYATQVMDKPLGIPVDWYRHGNALLTISHNRSSIQRVDVETNQETLLSQYDGKTPLLDTTGNLLFVDGSTIIDPTTEIAIELPNKITAVTKNGNELLLTVKAEPQVSIWRLNLATQHASELATLPASANRIAGVLDDGYLYEISENQKDIIQLRLN